MSAEYLVWYERSALTAHVEEETVHSAPCRARGEGYGLYPSPLVPSRRALIAAECTILSPLAWSAECLQERYVQNAPYPSTIPFSSSSLQDCI
jgi:hypothetical protein